jgi:tyrosine-specific transport protein
MDGKLCGGIFLVVGTAIGAGILALPVVCATMGTGMSVLMLFVCWLISMFSGFLFLEVLLWFENNSHFISISKAMLGTPGKIIAWITSLLLLYALLCAYISGCSDILTAYSVSLNWHVSESLITIGIAVLFSLAVIGGVASADLINRGLMVANIIVFLLLIGFISPHIQASYIYNFHKTLSLPTIMVIITAYSFAFVLPSLKNYFNGDIRKLRIAIFLGCFIPFLFYVSWVVVVQGVVPAAGKDGLLSMLTSGRSTSELTYSLSVITHNGKIIQLSNIFAMLCIVTSLLGVSVSLIDFFLDVIKTRHKKLNQYAAFFLTFVPPTVIILIDPGAFILALKYAGAAYVILLILLPSLMVWRGRYVLQMESNYQVMGGKWLLATNILISIFLLIFML